MQWIKIGSQENHSQIHDQTLQSTINQTDDDDDADTCPIMAYLILQIHLNFV